MPAFSFHRPRFLRSRRERSPPPQPFPVDLHDDAAAFPPPHLDSTPAPPSHLSSRRGVPGKDANAMAAGTSSPGNLVDYRDSTGSLLVERAPRDLSDQPSQALRPVLKDGVAESNSAQMLSAQNSIAPQSAGHRQLPYLPKPVDSAYFPQTQALQHSPCLLAPSSQQSLDPQHPIQPSSLFSPQPERQNQGMFNQAHDFTVMGTFIENNVTHNDFTSNQFMKELLEKTIPGAEFDSSDRDPPPRCHAGTRLAILDRCLHFIRNCGGERKMRWIFGAAGVGKSAVMQSVVESPELAVSCHASVFFSINGRNDGTKAIITISYQFAAKCKPYRQLVEMEITRDPSLLRSSMARQFLKLIVEPFIHNPQLNCAGRILVVIDGLDECSGPRIQQELLRLISDFCIKYPSSPLVWLIASRPEAHITSFFSKAEVMSTYEKEEIPVDSDESRADVERFLRDEFTDIKNASDSLDPKWPEERDLWKVANASCGLFAYAQTVIRYIGDWASGSPASQLADVLNVIDNHPLTDVPREDHPMASLDALYARILSNVPPRAMVNTRKLLLICTSDWYLVLDTVIPQHIVLGNLVTMCNWLGMTPDETYAAINHLRSVLHVPKRNQAHEERLHPFHKSFVDYVCDFTRSGFSADIQREALQLKTRMLYGTMRRVLGTGDKISLTWPVDNVWWDDSRTRLEAYKLAIGEVISGVERGDSAFQSEFCIHLLTTRFEDYRTRFPFHAFGCLLFDEPRRHEFMMSGIIKRMPLKAVDHSQGLGEVVKLQFRRPATTNTNLSDPWDSYCEHVRLGDWEEGKEQDWMAFLGQYGCYRCEQRLDDQLEDWKTQFPDHPVLVVFNSTGHCCVEFRFVDPEDGMSEWTYWFWCYLSAEERKKYGSLI
ncbi:hypothetical protein Agabi119p4_7994 [Agaricus bisporus var. burnettii]|uniref:Nephrocystin 3-like N-terminal domain-containing protein n=1 Tax=Agaricus bisporus var. burnettii TaxID=192524 RepID=A0A8H7C5V5_AGABI|nr:hypothetical protein Agabi119p4_7994 [Agaricus bisporus var. burnettii]